MPGNLTDGFDMMGEIRPRPEGINHRFRWTLCGGCALRKSLPPPMWVSTPGGAGNGLGGSRAEERDATSLPPHATVRATDVPPPRVEFQWGGRCCAFPHSSPALHRGQPLTTRTTSRPRRPRQVWLRCLLQLLQSPKYWPLSPWLTASVRRGSRSSTIRQASGP